MRLFYMALSLLAVAYTAVAQPSFKPFPAVHTFNTPGIAYIEHSAEENLHTLKVAYPHFGVWRSYELLSAPYIDVIYAAKGGSFIAAGESENACHIFAVNFHAQRTERVTTEPIPNPWVAEATRHWVVRDYPSSVIAFAYNPPDEEHVIVHKFSYNTNKVDTFRVPNTAFHGGVAEVRIKLASDANHFAYVTPPVEVPGQPNLYESTLKVIHFNNMSVTDATKSVKTHVAGGPDGAWAAFEFHSPTYVHYFTAEPAPSAPETRSRMTYKAVEIETSANNEFFTTTLPVPKSMGPLERDPENYHMTYTHRAAPAARYLVDHGASRSLLVYPEAVFDVADRDGKLRITRDGRTLFNHATPVNKFDSGIRSYFENYVFCLRHEDPARSEFHVWFYDPRGLLDAAVWSDNPITLVGVIEVKDPLKKKI